MTGSHTPAPGMHFGSAAGAVVILLGTLLLGLPGARAQAGNGEAQSAQHKAIARALFTEGLEHLDAERWVQAVDRFERVLQLQWSSAAAFNLAAALGHEGRPVEASELLHRVLRDQSTEAGLAEAASALLQELQAQICRLTVKLAGNADGAVVTLDGAELPGAAVGAPVPVDPGTHRVRARAGGQDGSEQTVMLGGEHPRELEVVLDLGRRDMAPASVASASVSSSASMALDGSLKPQDESDGSVLRQWWFWTAIGVTVAAVVTAAVVFPIEQTSDPVQGDFKPSLVQVSVP